MHQRTIIDLITHSPVSPHDEPLRNALSEAMLKSAAWHHFADNVRKDNRFEVVAQRFDELESQAIRSGEAAITALLNYYRQDESPLTLWQAREMDLFLGKLHPDFRANSGFYIAQGIKALKMPVEKAAMKFIERQFRKNIEIAGSFMKRATAKASFARKARRIHRP